MLFLLPIKKGGLSALFVDQDIITSLITYHTATARTLAVTGAGGDAVPVVLPAPAARRGGADWVAGTPPVALASATGSDTAAGATAGYSRCAATATAADRWSTAAAAT